MELWNCKIEFSVTRLLAILELYFCIHLLTCYFILSSFIRRMHNFKLLLRGKNCRDELGRSLKQNIGQLSKALAPNISSLAPTKKRDDTFIK